MGTEYLRTSTALGRARRVPPVTALGPVRASPHLGANPINARQATHHGHASRTRDSVQFRFPAACKDHDHLYHGQQVDNQVPPR
jgi:hypothetical protein